jgi:hypothetical protein
MSHNQKTGERFEREGAGYGTKQRRKSVYNDRETNVLPPSPR